MNLRLALSLATLLVTPALADPPSHAPAHGYYKKQHDDRKPAKAKHYQGRSGAVYARDYGISTGRCNRDEIGAVIGGISGAVIGGQVAGRDDRVVGMVVGGVLGAVVGHAIGEHIDEGDRACMGHALELGRPGVPVAWRNDGHRYNFTPGAAAADGCRHATVSIDGGKPRAMLACPGGRGEWSFRRR